MTPGSARRLILLLALYALAPSSPATADEATPVRVATVHPILSVPTERYAATLQARIETPLGFRVAGKIVARRVNVGDRVEPGTVLEQLDPTDLALDRRVAIAQVAAAEADLTKSDADFRRGAKLLADGWITRSIYDSRQQSRDAAAARLRQARENLQMVEDNLKYATLLADAPGVITAVQAEPGQVVSVGQPVLRLAHQGEIEAVVDLPEQMVARLDHTRFKVTLWVDPGRRIPARLREVAPSADPATRTYRVRLTLENPPSEAQLGMTATVLAEDTASSEVVLLPMTALFHDGLAPAVWVVDPAAGRVDLRKVTLAAYLDDQIAVAQGLHDGDEVVTAGAFKLSAADHVRVWTEPER
jgi:RND family efflux transporter MFP subunit